jgi:hypothetical protein
MPDTVKVIVHLEKVKETGAVDWFIGWLTQMMNQHGYLLGVMRPDGFFLPHCVVEEIGIKQHLFEDEYTIVPDKIYELEEMI